MRVWVTGAQGQVGRILMQTLSQQGIDCVGTGHEEIDIADEKQVCSQVQGITHIVNAAAYAQVDPAEINPEIAHRTNAIGPKVLAKTCQRFGIHLLHISTDYVFDGRSLKAYEEEDIPCPLNIYGNTKLEGELAVQNDCPSACIVRASWVFGGGGPTDYVTKVLSILQTEKYPRFVADQISCPTYVFDLVQALIVLLKHRGLYHYCNEGFLSKYDFALAIWERAKKASFPVISEEIIPILSSSFKTAAKRPLHTPLNTEKIRRFVSIRPWTEALDELFTKMVYL